MTDYELEIIFYLGLGKVVYGLFGSDHLMMQDSISYLHYDVEESPPSRH